MKNQFITLVCATLLAGCNTVPERLQVAEQTPLLKLSEGLSMTRTDDQTLARWGGSIASIDNRSDSTVIDVVAFKLNSRGKPVVGDESQGRFRVYIQGFLDPAIYQPGRAITALGQVVAAERVMVGDYPLNHASLHGKELYLWPEVKEKDTEVVYVPYIVRLPVYVPR